MSQPAPNVPPRAGIKARPNDRALRAYLRLMRKEGKLDDVVSLAEANLSTDPATPRSVARYARMVSFAGKPDLAVTQYRSLIESGAAREVDKVRSVAALIAAGHLDEARSVIKGLKDRRAMQPLKEKLNADIELASGRPEKAIDLYRTACTSARVDGLDGAQRTPQEQAEAWKSYTAKALREQSNESKQIRLTGKGPERAATKSDYAPKLCLHHYG